jgi:hypothetical protein
MLLLTGIFLEGLALSLEPDFMASLIIHIPWKRRDLIPSFLGDLWRALRHFEGYLRLINRVDWLSSISVQL